MNRATMLCISAVAAIAQLRPTVPQPTNLDFSCGAIGQMPPGWDMPQFVLDAGYRGNGTGWFDAMRIEVNSEPYLNPPFDLDFESPAIKGFFAEITAAA